MPKASVQIIYTLSGYLIILVLLALATLMIGGGVYWMTRDVHTSDDSILKWGGLTVNTVALFGWIIKQCRRSWRDKVFWATLGVLLIIHVAGFTAVLMTVAHWRLAWFFVICTLEVIPISTVLDWSTGRFGRSGEG